MPDSEPSLPDTLDGDDAARTISARTRQDNVATTTIFGNFSEPNRKILEKLDQVQAAVDYVKISGSPFTGSVIKTSKQSTFLKFLINMKKVAIKAVNGCPAATNAVVNINAIITELRPAEELPEFFTIFNEFIFDLLMGICDEEALNIVLRYEFSDDAYRSVKKDGRRALFALMQTYAPVSTNAGNNVKAKLERIRFTQDKALIQDQITEYYIMVQQYEVARSARLEITEAWAFVTSAIKGANWQTFRLIMATQSEYKQHKVFWLIDQIREYVLAIEDDNDTSPSTTPGKGREKSILNAAQATENQFSKSDELIATVNRLAASVAAITTSKETSSRIKGKPFDERPWDPKMGPCRFCGGGHRHRNCNKLKTSLPKPQIHPRAGAVRAAADDDDTPGFLMGVVATDGDSCPTSPSSFITFMAILTALFWFVVALIPAASRGQIPVCGGSLGAVDDTYCGFGVDTCASHHICDNLAKFSSIDFSRTKTFDVVHDKTITSQGVGNVTLNVKTTSGVTKEVVLVDVHYMPNQRMCLVSVGKAMTSQGFSSPDLEKLTWKADNNCTLKLIKTNSTFQLDASVKYSKWTKSGIKVERQGAKH